MVPPDSGVLIQNLGVDTICVVSANCPRAYTALAPNDGFKFAACNYTGQLGPQPRLHTCGPLLSAWNWAARGEVP